MKRELGCSLEDELDASLVDELGFSLIEELWLLLVDELGLSLADELSLSLASELDSSSVYELPLVYELELALEGVLGASLVEEVCLALEGELSLSLVDEGAFASADTTGSCPGMGRGSSASLGRLIDFNVFCAKKATRAPPVPAAETTANFWNRVSWLMRDTPAPANAPTTRPVRRERNETLSMTCDVFSDTCDNIFDLPLPIIFYANFTSSRLFVSMDCC